MSVETRVTKVWGGRYEIHIYEPRFFEWQWKASAEFLWSAKRKAKKLAKLEASYRSHKDEVVYLEVI